MVNRLWSPVKGNEGAESYESSSTHDPITSSSKQATRISLEESPQATTPSTQASSPESTSSCDNSHSPASPEMPSWFPLGGTPKQPPPAPAGWLPLIAWLVKCARGMAVAQMSIIWIIAAAAASLASCAGAMIIVFLIVTRRYAPASLDYVRPLHFDYTAKDGRAVAISPLVQGQQMEASAELLLPALPGARFLPSGQQIELWVEVTLPETERNQGVFQMVGELLAADSRVVARSSRPFMLKHQSPLVKMIRSGFVLPWAVLGLYDESVQLQLHLFDSFEEREAFPVAYFRATLLPAAGNAPLPLLYDASVHIRLKLGLLQWVLYCIRPSLVVSWALAVLGVCLLAGGSTCGLLLLGVAVLLWYSSKNAAKQARVSQGRIASKAPFKQLPTSNSAKKVSISEIEAEPAEEQSDGEPTAGRRSNGNLDHDASFTAVDASSSRSHLTAANTHGGDSMSGTLRCRMGQNLTAESGD